ncbi:MAG: glycosyltransferase [Propionicimonas sp.]
MSRKVMVLAAGVGAGHNMAARAIEAELIARGPAGGVAEVRRIDALDTTNEAFTRLYGDAYFTLVSEVPWLVAWGYDSQDPPFKVAPLMKWFEQANTTSLVREIRDFDPDVVICTHFLPARLVSIMLARRQLRATLSVVTTDFDFQGLWLTSPFTHMLVARDETREYLRTLGIPGDRLIASGIPVRPELSQPLDADQVRADFGLRPDLPVVVISAGAAGGDYALEIVRQALRIGAGFQAVVVCGRNDDLRARAERLASGHENFHVLGFTDRLTELMRIAALFVGKPGGLSSSECLAAGVPMVIINPIPGQEERNSDYLLEEGAAVRCNYSTTVGYKIGRLLADPSRLGLMAANARRIGRVDAAARVADSALTGDLPPLWISRNAQKSIQRVGTDGIAVSELPGGSVLRRLVDPETGGSRALVTEAELGVLGVAPGRNTVELSRTWLRALQWQPENLTLAMAGKWMLDGADTATFRID